MWKATSKATAANWIYNELVSPWTKFRVAAFCAERPPRVSFATGCVSRGVGREQASEPRSSGKIKNITSQVKHCWWKEIS